MALFAIGDLHLSFNTNKSMDTFGGAWVNHEKKVVRYFNREVKPEDTLVLVGDHSWGKDLDDCSLDLAFIQDLPGKKILTRGNHDMFWDSGKTNKLNELFQGKLQFLQGKSFCSYGDIALVGTKGHTYEGKETPEHAQLLIRREVNRLEQSFQAAEAAGYQRFIVFLHYPPTNLWEKESDFTRLAEAHHAEQVIYAHCHGEARFHDSIRGNLHGIEYSLVSGDCLEWHPKCIVAEDPISFVPKTQ